MKKVIIFLFCIVLFAYNGFTQCENADFSGSSSFENWTGSTGTNLDGVYTNEFIGLVQGTANATPHATGRHTIMNIPGTDPNTQNMLSVLPPGGTSSCRLGNSYVSAESIWDNAYAERLSYTYTVNSSNCIFTYQYAVVLQDAASSSSQHTDTQVPKFSIYVLNSSGALIDPVCGKYEVSAALNLPGFVPCLPASDVYKTDVNVVWKDWTTVAIDLSAHINENITIQFTTYDCTLGGHFGYAYIACSCSSLELSQACSGLSNIITAPPGFQSYQWTWPQGTQNTGTTNSLTLNNTQFTNGDSLICQFVTVQGCTLTLRTVLAIDPPVFSPAAPTICSGETATITASGEGEYTYEWSTHAIGASISVNPTTTEIYTVTATTPLGCYNSSNVTVTVNPLPVANAGPDASICPSSSTVLDASNSTGNAPLTYNWNNSITDVSQSVNPSNTTTYTVTVTDVNGCTASDAVTVNINNNATVTVPPATVCPGGSTSLTASGAGNYQWSPSTGLSDSTGTTVTASPSVTTTYSVYGNLNGCTGSTTVTVTVAPNPTITVTPDPTICPGASTPLLASGGSTYTWSPGTGLSSTTGASITAHPTITTTYTVTGTSTQGCTGSTSVTVNVEPFTASTTYTDEICSHADGTATVTPSVTCGQTWGYNWNTVPPQHSAMATNLPAGTYTVTINCGACTATASAVINNLPGPSVSIISVTNTSCGYNNGGASALASGGQSTDYNYLWSNGQTGDSLSNVYAGTYQVTVTDHYLCTAVNSVTITDTPGPHASVTGIIPTPCGFSDGALTVTATGGTPGYTYSWGTTPVQNSDTAISLAEGTYIVTVTDNNGCSTTTSASVPELPGPTASSTSTPEYCNQSNGTATATGAGGLGNYNYSWNTTPPQYTQVAENLPAGTYTVTVDDGGCSATTSVDIYEIPGPLAGFSAWPKELTIMDGPVSFLDHSIVTIIGWQWTLGDGSTDTISEFTHQYENIGTYPVTLIVEDNNHCRDTAIDTIRVKDIFALYIPNAFTPNDDGINDGFTPYGINVDPETFEMYIFDRWGNMIYYTNKWYPELNRCEPWNGTEDNKGTYKDVIMDVYVYRVLCKEIEGHKHEYIGRVSLIP
ncbi:MAG TPA: PKD domain-containing protein [Bacteroidales bacterium]|nr:PKD domain-containing protein [Bacteroidales bacterium]HPS18045.1 PKD domain-containing protein [Bacteroidales bacterium]